MKILIGGSGGAPSEGVIKSLKLGNSSDQIIGMGSDRFDLAASQAEIKYLIENADHIDYKKQLMSILKKEKPALLHVQNDLEVLEVSRLRKSIEAQGVKCYMPDHDVIDKCVFKYKSYNDWKKAGIRLPESMMINDENDLKRSFDKLSDKEGYIWLRSSDIGGGGKGALPANDYEFAKRWIDRFNGWGSFIAAQMLTPKTVTWLSIWYEGELVVAQSRIRKGWTHGNRTLSGVTGVTKIGETFSDEVVDTVALDSIRAVDKKPHGIYGVDMAYDNNGFPNPTEINIARFFTTVLFFTEAGLNMPDIYRNIALHGSFPSLAQKINPLPDGLLWIRGMDRAPMLTSWDELDKSLIKKI